FVTVVPSFLFPGPPPAALSTLSLHDALPILPRHDPVAEPGSETLHLCLDALGHVHVAAVRDVTVGPRRGASVRCARRVPGCVLEDRKSTRLNSSHVKISYAVFCLKKKKKKEK